MSGQGNYNNLRWFHPQINVEPSRVILPRICDRGSVVRYSEMSVQQPEAEVEAERYKKRKFTFEQLHQLQPVAKRVSPGHVDAESNQVNIDQCYQSSFG